MKTISIMLAAAILSSACSKTIKEINSGNKPETNPESVTASTREREILKKLLSSQTPNVALAEVLAHSIPKEHRDEIKEVVKSLTEDEAKAIVSKVLEDSEKIRNSFLFHNQRYQDNSGLIENSLVNPKRLADAQFSSENMLKTSVFTYLKDKTLDQIVTTYEKRASELSRELAQQIALELGKENPEIGAMIDREHKEGLDRFIQALQKSEPFLRKVDTYFKNSTLNVNEQGMVVMSGVVAGAMYVLVKDNKDFKSLVKKAQQIAGEIKDIMRKADELIVLAQSLDKHATDLGRDIRNLDEGIRGADADLRLAFREARPLLEKPTNIHSRRIVNFLHENVISGNVTGDGNNTSLFSRPINISENIKKSVAAAGNISQNLSAIISTSTQMANLLGVKFSPGTQKLLDTANKVAAVAQVASTIIAGISSGGALTAVSALGALGGVGGLGGFGGGGNNNAAEFAMINAKLDQILKNQQKIMEMQVETMKMIKDLAIMVDEYHQREMVALAALRDDVLVGNEMKKAELNKDVRSCERMISFQLSSVWKDTNFKLHSGFGIHNLDGINKKFLANIEGLSDIRRLIESGGENGFGRCQDAFGEAFGKDLDEENPVLAIFASNENNALYKWNRETYQPLLEYLVEVSGTTGLDSVPLHIPSANFTGQAIKAQYVDNVSDGNTDSENYVLEYLVSAKSLERYLTSLLVLYPILEVERNIWEKALEEIVDTYILNAGSGARQNTRSFYHLSNALKLIQTAIAQEAILAGEPVLHRIHRKFHKEIFSESACEKYEENSKFICSLRSNRLLAKNLLRYDLNARFSDSLMREYEQAFVKKDFKTLSFLLNNHIGPTRIMEENERIVLQMTLFQDRKEEQYNLPLPSPEEIKSGTIMYSENMNRLLKMQMYVLEALDKVTPMKRTLKEEDQLKLFFVGA